MSERNLQPYGLRVDWVCATVHTNVSPLGPALMLFRLVEVLEWEETLSLHNVVEVEQRTAKGIPPPTTNVHKSSTSSQ